MSNAVVNIDPAKSFQFLAVADGGPDSGTRCPHCGAEGRYIYQWAEYGVMHAAMAGCYKALTRNVKKDDLSQVWEGIHFKQSRQKALNSWEKTIIRMTEFKTEGRYSAEWCDAKITEALSMRNAFIKSKR
jgi:hypothetical protein